MNQSPIGPSNGKDSGLTAVNPPQSPDLRRNRGLFKRFGIGSLALVVATTVVVACGGGSTGEGADSRRDNCTTVDVAVSPEKIDLLTDLAATFNDSDRAKTDNGCIFVDVRTKSSGVATTALAAGWDTSVDGPEPVIWSPASSSWGTILNQKLADAGKKAIAPDDPTPFMLTPLVIAMPQPMAEAMGYPEKPIGWSDILTLAKSKTGWADYGHPEWGPFRLGKTNPNYSTSGLSALIAQTYAATGKTSGLSAEDLANPTVVQYGTDIESSVVHYGDITMTFLNNWYRADRRGTALTYASAVAVEEKSVIDYNLGNPDGELSQGEKPAKPRTPLVAIYPTEGTLYSDNPFFILNAPWVDDARKSAAEKFQAFVQEAANQKKVLDYGFRPGNPDVKVGAPVSKANGVDPDQPQTLLEVPTGKVMVGLLNAWATQRKGARVMLVLDVSGSMGDPADQENSNGPTKLDLAKDALIEGLDDFKADDQVGLSIFTSSSEGTPEITELSPVAPIGPAREALIRKVNGLMPLRGTPLYDVISSSYGAMLEGYNPALINAVVVLTDGMNDDGNPGDDREQFRSLISKVKSNSDGESSKPVRIFTIAYGTGSDPKELRQVAEASNATAYEAGDATTINKVFQAVVSNF
ncbi:MAG TPA: extracellular solute-binding protein [Microthrixaceae bacterium]|nr:extracellular solute-binding protein [Microthrixaceae bacterium]